MGAGFRQPTIDLQSYRPNLRRHRPDLQRHRPDLQRHRPNPNLGLLGLIARLVRNEGRNGLALSQLTPNRFPNCRRSCESLRVDVEKFTQLPRQVNDDQGRLQL